MDAFILNSLVCEFFKRLQLIDSFGNQQLFRGKNHDFESRRGRYE